MQLESYVDKSQSYIRGHGGYALETHDPEFQHSFSLGDRQAVVWGAGGRLYADQFRHEGLVA
jgi:hypothetical protein